MNMLNIPEEQVSFISDITIVHLSVNWNAKLQLFVSWGTLFKIGLGWQMITKKGC